MDEQRAREILGSATELPNGMHAGGAIASDGSLRNSGMYLDWGVGDCDATLDGQFTAEVLEAIAWWMRNAPKPTPGE